MKYIVVLCDGMADYPVDALGVPMEVLVPNMLRKRGRDEARRYGNKDFRDNPWVENISLYIYVCSRWCA